MKKRLKEPERAALQTVAKQKRWADGGRRAPWDATAEHMGDVEFNETCAATLDLAAAASWIEVLPAAILFRRLRGRSA